MIPQLPQTSPPIAIAPGCPPDPVTEDTTYLNYRTWKNQTSTHLEVCSLLSVLLGEEINQVLLSRDHVSTTVVSCLARHAHVCKNISCTNVI